MTSTKRAAANTGPPRKRRATRPKQRAKEATSSRKVTAKSQVAVKGGVLAEAAMPPPRIRLAAPKTPVIAQQRTPPPSVQPAQRPFGGLTDDEETQSEVEDEEEGPIEISDKESSMDEDDVLLAATQVSERVEDETATQVMREVTALLEDTQTSPSPPSLFTFDVQLTAVLGVKRLYSDFKEHQELTPSLDEIREWLQGQQEAREPAGQRTRLGGITGVISYPRLKKPIKQSLDTEQNICTLRTRMRRWHGIDKREELTFEVIITLDKLLLVSTPRAASGPPPSSVVVPRNTATQIHRAGLDEGMQTAIDEGNYGPSITMKWLCTNPRCLNYQKSCWVDGGDVAHNHHFLTTPVLTIWALAIRDLAATASSPPPKALRLLFKEKEDREGTARKGNKQNNNTPFRPLIQGPLVSYGPSDSPQSGGYAASSPISSTTDDETILKDFFAWMRRQSRNSSVSERLEEVQNKLVLEAFDVDSLKDITETQWGGEWDFPRGLLPRFKKAASAYKKQRRTGGN